MIGTQEKTKIDIDKIEDRGLPLMILFDKQLQEEYKKNDTLLSLLNSIEQPEDRQFTSHRWLIESLPKRLIFWHMYSDLLRPTKERGKILDVGGGYTALTRLLLQYQDYRTLDIMAHDDHELLKCLQASLSNKFWLNSDWYQYKPSESYDLVIANDLFPNVDQRLSLFLDRYLPICSEMRLSLTYYNTARWYRVKRTDGDEIFHMMAWDGIQLRRVLEDYADYILEPKLHLFLENPTSLFANNRQVCMVVFRGQRRKS